MRSPLELMLPLITHPALCSCVHAEAQHATANANMLVRTMVHSGARNCAALPVSLLRLSGALARVPDLLVRAEHLLKCAKHLLERANRTGDGAKFARQRDRSCRAWRSRRPLDASGQILEPSGFLLLDISGTPNLMRAGYPLDRVPGGWTGSHPRTSRGRARGAGSALVDLLGG